MASRNHKQENGSRMAFRIPAQQVGQASSSLSGQGANPVYCIKNEEEEALKSVSFSIAMEDEEFSDKTLVNSKPYRAAGNGDDEESDDDSSDDDDFDDDDDDDDYDDEDEDEESDDDSSDEDDEDEENFYSNYAKCNLQQLRQIRKCA